MGVGHSLSSTRLALNYFVLLPRTAVGRLVLSGRVGGRRVALDVVGVHLHKVVVVDIGRRARARADVGHDTEFMTAAGLCG